MKVPRLNHRLTLEASVLVADGAGGFLTEWQPQGTLWGELRGMSGRERAENGQPVSIQSLRITVRAAPAGDPRRPKAGQRFRNGNRLFAIAAVTEASSDARYLICRCTEEESAR